MKLEIEQNMMNLRALIKEREKELFKKQLTKLKRCSKNKPLGVTLQ